MRDPSNPRSPVTVLADSTEHAGYMLVLMGQAFVEALRPRQPLRAFRRFLEQLYTQTVKSLAVVAIVGIFTGMVLALQTGEELRRWGAESQLSKIVASTLAREMGPFIAAIILAATVGASIAAEIGTMRVSEEIEALEVMNVDPVSYLVTPRIAALGFAAVVLTVLVDFVGVAGGALVANAQLGIRPADYFEGARQTLGSEMIFGVLPKDIFTGLVKSYVFGVMIAGLGCAAGMSASGGALGVGRAVRSAVVASVVLTLIVGYLLTWMFWA